MTAPRLVIHMTFDDLGREQVERYDAANTSPGYATQPFFDMLWDDGIRLEKHYAEGFCSPFRANHLAGRHTEDHGVGDIIEDDLDEPLLLKELLLPEVLRIYYRSQIKLAALGKWHLGNAQVGGKKSPLTAGFDYWFGSERNIVDFYNDPLSCQGQTYDPQGRFIPELLAEAAITWIRRFAAERSGRGYLYLPFHLPHNPFWRPPSDLYDTGLWTLPTEQSATPGGAPAVPYLKAYIEAANTLAMRIWDAIPARLRAETVLLASSDNGTEASMLAQESYPAALGGAAYVAGHGKRSNYDPGIRTPAWVYSENAAWCASPGRSITGVVQSLDWYATTLDLFEVPWEEIVETRGPRFGVKASERSKSFAGSLTAAVATTNRTYAYTGIFSPNGYNRGTASGLRAITDGRYKLMWPNNSTATDESDLYDIVDDPRETAPFDEDEYEAANGGVPHPARVELGQAWSAFYDTMPPVPT